MTAERLAAFSARLRDERLSDRVHLHPPATETEIAAAEAELGVRFPEGFRALLTTFNGGFFGGRVHGVGVTCCSHLVRVNQRARSADLALPPNLLRFGVNRYGLSNYCFEVPAQQEEVPVLQWPIRGRQSVRVRATGKALLDWLEANAEDPEAMPLPPYNWEDRQAWERYWRRTLDYGSVWFHALGRGESYAIKALPLLRSRGFRRLLFAGTGISLEPKAFAHAGFQVTALDVSPTACEFVRKAPWDEEKMSTFFQVGEPHLENGAYVHRIDRELTRQRKEQEQRPGGTWEVVCADFFNHQPAELYDALFNINSFQGFPPEVQHELAARFFSWLSPGGLCQIQTQNVAARQRGRLEFPFLEAGFLPEERATVNAAVARFNRLPDRERTATRLFEACGVARVLDEAATCRRMDAGAKIVCFVNGGR